MIKKVINSTLLTYQGYDLSCSDLKMGMPLPCIKILEYKAVLNTKGMQGIHRVLFMTLYFHEFHKTT